MDFILRPWLESDAKDLTIHLNNKKGNYIQSYSLTLVKI